MQIRNKSKFKFKKLWKRYKATRRRRSGSVKLFGKRFEYHYRYCFDLTYKELFNQNIYEFDADSDTPLILDCGANMGLSLLFFSKRYPKSRIIAFEPDETVLPCLRANITAQLMDNVELVEKAVWTEETSLNFFTDSGMGGRIGEMYSGQSPMSVRTVRLRDYLHDKIDFLKLDIEGAEYQVIKDCEDLLPNISFMFIEYHSRYDEKQQLGELLVLLNKAGFRYHIQESWTRKRPFVDRKLSGEKFEMAINVFAYR